MKLTELAIKRPAFMAMVFSALAIMGAYSYLNMGVDFLPKMDWPIVFVSAIYPGAGPEEIETQIAKPVEEALSSISGLKSLKTYSGENYFFAALEFEMSEDVNNVLNETGRKINEMKRNLPTEMEEPQVSKVDVNAAPILRIAVQSNIDPMEFYEILKNDIKPKFEQTKGVAVVSLIGGKEREIRVEVDNDKLKSYNLSILQVSQVLFAENLDFPVGKIEQREKSYIVRVAGKFTNIDDIRNMILVSNSLATVRLKDIATVIDTYKESYVLSRLNGQSSIGIIIQKASDANSIKTSDGVFKTIEQLEKEYAYLGLKFTIAQDITTFTRESLSEVGRDMILAVLLVAVVLFFFLHSARNSFIVLLAIPTSLFSAMIFISAFGFTINVITLMAITLVIGILVDDSIVVLENIHRHLELGEDSVTAAVRGRSEIGLAAIAITLVDVVVFLPIAMLSGMVGKIFREFGLTIVVSTLFSLLISFTLTPLLASRLSKITQFTEDSILLKFSKGFENVQISLRNKYKILLGWALDHRKTVISFSILLLILSLAMIPMQIVGTEFLPSGDRGEFALNIEMPLGTSIEKTNEITQNIEEMIRSIPEVQQCYSVIGRTEGAFNNSNDARISQLQIKLVSKNKRKASTQNVISKVLDKARMFPGVLPSASLISFFGAADMIPFEIEIKGEDIKQLITISAKVSEIINNTAGTRDVKSSWQDGNPEVKVSINRDKCATLNLTVGEVASTLRNAFEGDYKSKFRTGDHEYDIRIILSKKNRENPEDVRRVTLVNRLGQVVQLGDIADVSFGEGPTQIQRKDRARIITIRSNLDMSRPLGEVVNDLNKKISLEKFPPEITVDMAGEAEDMDIMFADMILAIVFAIIFIYMILVSLFESYLHPFTIMFSIPVALVGAFTAMALTHESLNILSMIGLLLSMGLVAKNSILLVDYTNTLRAQGKEMKEAILEAGPIRLRPIVMTTATMVFGMLPLALAGGMGGDFRRGMAIIVIGALLSSTLLTLVLVPVVYTVVESLRYKIPALVKSMNPFKK
jgi:HAE1 family hydrophobic/amphiphilic exporter-1